MTTRSLHLSTLRVLCNLLLVMSLLLSTASFAVATPPVPTPTPSASPTPPSPTPTPPVPPELPDEAEIELPPGLQGKLESPDGRVAVHVPTGALAHAARLKYRRLPPLELAPDRHIFHRFELNAWPAGHPELPSPAFNEPLMITVTYSVSDVEGLKEDGLRLVTWDEDLGAWTPISATLNVTANQVTAALSHFSLYALEGEDEAFFLPRIDAGQVSLFTGNSSFSYNFDTPAGAGGLGLPLTLRYDSSTPNNMRCSTCTYAGDDSGDGGWVGVGWTLDVGKIEDANLTLDSLSGQMQLQNKFWQGPAVSQCDWDGSEHCSYGRWYKQRWRLVDEQFARIEFTGFDSCTGSSCCGNLNPLLCPSPAADRVKTMGQWDVWAKDGTHYIFGSQEFVPDDPEHPENGGTGSRLHTSPADNSHDYKSWKLDTIVDTHGNRLEIDWLVFPKMPELGVIHLKESYPERIRYTKNTGASPADNHDEYEVRFEVVPKDEDVKEDKRLAETGYLLQQIGVYYLPVGGGEELIRRYELAYDNYGVHVPGELEGPEHYRLKEITQFASENESLHLPSVDFGYQDVEIAWKIVDGYGVQNRSVDRPFLSSVTNNYGGDLYFEYNPWCLSSENDAIIEDPGCNEEEWWIQHARVETKTVAPGLDSPQIVSEYDFDDPGYVLTPTADIPVESFIGFGTVMETVGEQRTTQTEFYNTFHNGNGHPKELMKGKTLSTKTGKLGAQGWQDYAYTENHYQQAEYYPEDPQWPRWARFIYVDLATTTTCTDGICHSQETEYSYDPALQGGVQYGNMTEIREYDDAGQLYRRTARRYNVLDTYQGTHPNYARYYVADRMVEEALYGGPGSAAASVSWYYYDNLGNHLQPLQPTQPLGELWATQSLLDPAPAGGDVYWDASETRYEYDDYGNQTDTTNYRGYARMRVDGTGAAYRVDPPTDPVTTTTIYDDDHYTFPVQVINPLQQSQWTTYYGINDNPSVGKGLPGQVKRTRDANDSYTLYQYDDFGRPTFVWLPGDEAWDTDAASTVITYEVDLPLSPPTWKYSAKRDDVEPEGYLESWRFYDGLGRLIQTQSESANTDEFIVTNRAYNALGQVLSDTLPYTLTGTLGTYQAPDWDLPATRYEYDALGRSTEVTNPDASSTAHFYHGRQEAVIDANQHLKVYDNDAFGRLATVWEFLGEHGQQPVWNGAGAYATTSYVYDVRDNLVTVYDANAHEANGNLLPTPPYSTTMQYDMLGRKTGMDDPDMGQWQYTYDALGNLVDQTDAKGQKVCMYYDGLSRLEFKRYQTAAISCCEIDIYCLPDASFYYDEFDPEDGQYGRGRRTSMSNSTSFSHWTYNARGQVTRESKTIAGGLDNPYVTEYGYDAMGRVITLTYPSGEMVTTSYDTQGLPLSTSGDAEYVTTSTYNPQGQANRFELGNGATTTYRYYDEDNAPSSPSYRLWQVRTFTETDALRLEYTYDNVGNVQTITDLLDGSSQVQHFTYDALGRLTNGWTTGGGQGAYNQAWQYDEIGNIVSFAGMEYGYGQPEGIALGARPHAVTHVGEQLRYLYDANGNVTGTLGIDGYAELVWDVENRLIRARQDDSRALEFEFAYDGDGNLVRKITPAGYTIYAGPGYEEFVDTVPPKVVEVTPTLSAGDVPITVTLQARFDEPVRPIVPLDQAFTLRPDPSTSVTGTVSLLHTDNQTVGLQLDPGADLLTCHVYTATVDGFADLSGNTMDTFSWRFKTADVLPQVGATHMLMAAVDQRLAATVTVTLTEDVTCPDNQCLQIVPAGGGDPVPGTLIVAGRVVSFYAVLDECTAYTATVAGLVDLDCGEANVPYAWTFSTRGIAPRLAATDPAANEQDVALDHAITLTFDEPIVCPSGNCVRVTKGGRQRLIPVYGSLTVNGTQAIFTPYGDLEESTQHHVSGIGFQDQACGVAMATESWQFETVHVPPHVVDYFPASGATCVPVDAAAWVRFDEPVEPVPPLTFTLATDVQPPMQVEGDSDYILPLACPSGLSCTWAIGAVLTPSSVMTEDVWFRADVSGPHDAYGNELVPFNWLFKSDDSVPPDVTETEPADRSVDIYPDEPIVAWLDDWLSAVGDFVVQPDPGVDPIPGTVSLVSRDNPSVKEPRPTGVLFDPDEDLQEATKYQAIVVGVVDECGNEMTQAYTWQFQTACLLGEGGKPSELVASCDRTGFTLESGEIEEAKQYEWRVVEAGAPSITVTSGLDLRVDFPYPGQSTEVQVRGRDENGCITHWSEPAELTWEGCFPGAPVVTAVSPPDAAQGISITAGVIVTFNEVVHVGSVYTTPNVSLSAGGQEVTGTMQVNAAYDELWAWSVRFVPAGPLAEKMTYQAAVTGATDSHGRVMTSTHEWGFTTGDYTPPSVVATAPGADAFGQTTTTTVVAYFDEPLTEPSLGTGVEFELTGPRGPVLGAVSYEGVAPAGQGTTPWRLIFTPFAALATDAVYTATLSGAEDLAGNVMASSHTWWFATPSTQPFVVVGTGPESGAVGVPLTATLSITYNKHLLAGSEGTTSFTLFRADDQKQEPLAGQLALDGSRLRFFPAQPLDPATVYQVRVVGATSFLGDRQLTPYHWTFETLDPEPPQVTRTEPEKDETGVPRTAAITVYFQKAIRVGGQNLKFTLTGPDGEVDGYLEWVPGDTYPAGYGVGEMGGAELGWNTEGRYQGYRAVRFRPLKALEGGDTYEATIEGVESLSGIPMEEPYRWSFTTNHAAVTAAVVTEKTSYYYLHNGQRVAMRKTGVGGEEVVYWLVGDHLGTTSLVLDEEGNEVAESRHLPYGGVRWADGEMPTDYRFTGQLLEEHISIYRMGARWYDGSLGRWLSPDMLVPNFDNPQSLNRFTYVYNQAVNNVDRSGRAPCSFLQTLINPFCSGVFVGEVATSFIVGQIEDRSNISGPSDDNKNRWGRRLIRANRGLIVNAAEASGHRLITPGLLAAIVRTQGGPNYPLLGWPEELQSAVGACRGSCSLGVTQMDVENATYLEGLGLMPAQRSGGRRAQLLATDPAANLKYMATMLSYGDRLLVEFWQNHSMGTPSDKIRLEVMAALQNNKISKWADILASMTSADDWWKYYNEVLLNDPNLAKVLPWVEWSQSTLDEN